MLSEKFILIFICLIVLGCNKYPPERSLNVSSDREFVATPRFYQEFYPSTYLDTLFGTHADRVVSVDWRVFGDSTVRQPNTQSAKRTVRLDFDGTRISAPIASCALVSDSVIAVSMHRGGLAFVNLHTQEMTAFFGNGKGPGEFGRGADVQSDGEHTIALDAGGMRLNVYGPDMAFVKTLPFRSGNLNPMVGLSDDHAAIVEDLVEGGPRISRFPLGVAQAESGPNLPLWFKLPVMRLYNQMNVRENSMYAVVASMGTPYLVVYKKPGMSVHRIVQIHFMQGDLAPFVRMQGAETSSTRLEMSQILAGVRLESHHLYINTRYTGEIIRVDLSAEPDTAWSLLRVSRLNPGQTPADFDSKKGIFPPLVQLFDVMGRTLVACGKHDASVDVFRF